MNRNELGARVALDTRVARGAALLDQTKPGWEQKINLDWLNIRIGPRCVLGQLYGDYADGRRHCGIDPHQAIEHGFEATVAAFTLGGGTCQTVEARLEYEALTSAWKRFILSRLRALAA